MQSIRRIVLALVVFALSLSTIGCSAQDGVQDGVQDGLASVVAALIEAPVQAWLNVAFPA